VKFVSGFGQEIEEEDLFAAALALPVSERNGYLQRACSGDSALLTRLNALLAAFNDALNFIEDESNGAFLSANRIGAYNVLRELGEGGCGVAYLAEQTSPVRRQVALKVVKPGMDTKAVIARFEAERQVLALLDHPNIAKVFDAGATIEGRPYFVMEVVRGIRITEFCAQSRMTVSQRLSLFIQVCNAIQHAHQKGIIHRDIKPSNVLVTLHDGLPLAKVIDFGIAKATQGKLIDQTLHTEIDQIMGTPAYISPEQTRATHTAVDTRSDIYSLGVLLYELLTGHTPFDARELAEVSLERFRERICTEEPLRPSNRLNSFDAQSLGQIAARSSATPSKLIREVKGDLDWIIMQCLEKTPSRRYQAVNELIADIQRYLRHELVLARPPSLIYTVRKLFRRNRVASAAVLASIVLLLFIAAFAITVAVHAQRIAAERDEAERARQRAERFSNVVQNAFAMADPFHGLANDVSGLLLLKQAAKSIDDELRDQPGPRARLLQQVGLAYARRGDSKLAIGYLEQSVQLLGETQAEKGEILRAMIDLAYALRISGDLARARAVVARGDELARRAGLQQSPEYAKLLLNNGRIALAESRIIDARAEFQRSLDLYRTVIGTRRIQVAEVLTEMSETFMWTDDHVQAEQTARESLAILEFVAAPMHPDRVRTEALLAEALYHQGQLDEAGNILVDALRKTTELFGRDSADVVDVLDRLAIVRYSQRRLIEAEQLSHQAIASARIAYGERHAAIGSLGTTLARTLIDLHKYQEAEATLRETLKVFAVTLPTDHQYVASTEYFLGELLIDTHRFSEAEAVLRASVHRWERAGAPSWRAARSANALGEALYRQGRTQEAERLLTESFNALSADTNPDVPAREKARERFARYMAKLSPAQPSTSTDLQPAAAQ
jgi:serine/threonine protein kinase/predicted negative regulator of RcsB-dependent stress response